MEAEDELCEENASATVEGTIKEIEDVTDENETEKTWLLWPDTDTQKSSCLYEGIFIHGSLSKDCKAGSKFESNRCDGTEGNGRRYCHSGGQNYVWRVKMAVDVAVARHRMKSTTIDVALAELAVPVSPKTLRTSVSATIKKGDDDESNHHQCRSAPPRGNPCLSQRRPARISSGY